MVQVGAPGERHQQRFGRIVDPRPLQHLVVGALFQQLDHRIRLQRRRPVVAHQAAKVGQRLLIQVLKTQLLENHRRR
ncbi:hypothetical protein D9M71_810650 [compost metagenome]